MICGDTILPPTYGRGCMVAIISISMVSILRNDSLLLLLSLFFSFLFLFAGIYGTKEVGTLSTVPGARYFTSLWADLSGAIWLFGGDGASNVTGRSELEKCFFFFSSSLTGGNHSLFQ